jgi:flagellar L-ring protein precursor FlgH
MKYLLLATFFIFGSCASYVNKMHRQIDNDRRAQYRGSRQARPQGYAPRYQRYGDRRPISNPVTIGGARQSTRNTPNLPPQTKRNFDGYGKRRITANDLKDNEQSGSLWTGKHSESFLFVTNNIKRAGDIVIVEVMNPLKETIQDELIRTFPVSKSKKSDKSKKGDKVEKTKEEVAVKETDEKKVYDKISTQVIEEINKDYLLVRGRKEVMFKTKKRFIEFQALVSRKDISNDDAVKSTQVIEPKITVLRY